MKKKSLKITEKEKKNVEKTFPQEMLNGENKIDIGERPQKIRDPRYKFDIGPYFDSDKNINDIHIPEPFEMLRINDKVHIVPYIERIESHILKQHEIDFWLFHNIYYRIELREMIDFLDYQLELCLSKEVQNYMEENGQPPYKNTKERLIELKSLLADVSYFDSKKYFHTLPSVPVIKKLEFCKIWVNEKLNDIENSKLQETTSNKTNQLQITKEEIEGTEEIQINTIENQIQNYFSFMQSIDPRKHKQILNQLDYDNLIQWVTAYFLSEKFKLPKIDNPIKKVNTTKGNIIFTFVSFFDALHPEKTRPKSLFELIKLCFEEYRNDQIVNIEKSTKEPTYYSQTNKFYNKLLLPK